MSRPLQRTHTLADILTVRTKGDGVVSQPVPAGKTLPVDGNEHQGLKAAYLGARPSTESLG